MVKKASKKVVKQTKKQNKAVKEAVVEATTNEIRAKELYTQGYNSKDVADVLGINKYQASKLIKGRD